MFPKSLQVQKIQTSVKIIRADGSVEDLGVVSTVSVARQSAFKKLLGVLFGFFRRRSHG
jgi:hypothetical protein